MKRFISVFMVLFLMLYFCACKKNSGKKKAEDKTFSSDLYSSEVSKEKETSSSIKEGISDLNSAEITIEKQTDSQKSKDNTESKNPASDNSISDKSDSSKDDGFISGYY